MVLCLRCAVILRLPLANTRAQQRATPPWETIVNKWVRRSEYNPTFCFIGNALLSSETNKWIKLRLHAHPRVNYHLHLHYLIGARIQQTNKQKAEQDFPVVLCVLVLQHLAAPSYPLEIGRHNNVLVLPPSISSARYFCLNDLGVWNKRIY